MAPAWKPVVGTSNAWFVLLAPIWDDCGQRASYLLLAPAWRFLYCWRQHYRCYPAVGTSVERLRPVGHLHAVGTRRTWFGLLAPALLLNVIPLLPAWRLPSSKHKGGGRRWYQLGRCLFSPYIVVSRATDTTGALVPAVWYQLGRCLISTYIVVSRATDTTGDLVHAVWATDTTGALAPAVWYQLGRCPVSTSTVVSRATDTTGALVPAVWYQLGRCLIGTYIVLSRATDTTGVPVPAVWYQLGRSLISHLYSGKQSDRYDWRSGARCVVSAWAVSNQHHIVVSRATEYDWRSGVRCVVSAWAVSNQHLYCGKQSDSIRLALWCPLCGISLGGV